MSDRSHNVRGLRDDNRCLSDDKRHPWRPRPRRSLLSKSSVTHQPWLPLRSDVIMADLHSEGRSFETAIDELVAIPRLAEQVGVTPRVLRYWEEQGLISPTREHGKLRYSPRDVAIARLTKRLLEAGASVDGIRMLKDLSEREIRRAAEAEDEAVLSEAALRLLYQRKAFREATGMNEEHYPHGDPKPPEGGPDGHHGPGPKKGDPQKKKGRKPPGPPGL